MMRNARINYTEAQSITELGSVAPQSMVGVNSDHPVNFRLFVRQFVKVLKLRHQ